jgi:hypothetical protein
MFVAEARVVGDGDEGSFEAWGRDEGKGERAYVNIAAEGGGKAGGEKIANGSEAGELGEGDLKEEEEQKKEKDGAREFAETKHRGGIVAKDEGSGKG